MFINTSKMISFNDILSLIEPIYTHIAFLSLLEKDPLYFLDLSFQILNKFGWSNEEFDRYLLNFIDMSWFNMENSCPVSINEQLIVEHVTYAKSIVSSIEWLPEECRFKINLNWFLGDEYIGNSYVFSSDHMKTWRKLSEYN